MLMSAHHSLRLHSPLKTVFGKIGDTYQAYCSTYKTHAMATHHGGSGNPLDKDIDVTRGTHKTADTDIENAQDFNPVETDHFEDLEHNNPIKTDSSHKGSRCLMSTSSGWGRTAHRHFELQRM